jgi:beta-1,4-mannosyltransferase
MSDRTAVSADRLEGRSGGEAMGTVMGWPAYRNRRGNPYNWLLSRSVERWGWSVEEFTPAALLTTRPALWHIHWPDRFLNRRRFASALVRSTGVLVLVWLARRLGIRVVWSIHNLQSHDGFHPRLERRFWSAFTRQVDAIVGLTEEGVRAARARFPTLTTVPGTVVPHGHYRGEYPREVGRDEARRELELPADARILLFFGRIREYKNVPRLIRTFRELTGDDLLLLVAGEPDSPALADTIRREASDDARVRLALHHVADETVQHWFAAADLVVLPYAEILNSGTALLALSFDRPVLVPGKGAMEELRAAVTERWVRTYPGDFTASELDRALAWATAAEREDTAPLEAMEWDRIGERMAQAYAAVLRRNTSARSPATPLTPARGEVG